MKFIRLFKNPYVRLGFNIAYALGNSLLGLLTHSRWFLILGAYYVLLSMARFCLLRFQPSEPDNVHFARRTVGILLVGLSFCLIGINILSALKDRGTVHHEIVMIAIATYTFTKITLAIFGLIKASHTPLQKALRNLSFADAMVSVYALQRSMLVSFPGLTPAQIRLFNILTGTGVWIILLCLGINLIGGKTVNMAKSKLAKINKKIAQSVTTGYKTVEKGVVSGYKVVETSFVNGYAKVEDKFVEAFLTKDGETTEEAKARLKKK